MEKTRLKKLGRVLAGILVLIVAACSEGGLAVTSSDTPRSEVIDGKDRVEAAKEVVLPLTEFGFDLHNELASDDRNVVFSPHSIAVALAMTRAGAVADTASEMDAVLHSQDVEQFDSSVNALDLAIASAAGQMERPDGSSAEVVVDITNAIWAQDGLGFEDAFLTTLAENYGAGVNLVDYENDHEAARVEINRWVADQTRDRIDELLAPGILSAITRLVLTNAIYLKAPWLHPFEEQETTTAPFTTLDGSNPSVDLMSVSASLRYTRVDDLQAVELPYVGGQLAMLVIVPNEAAMEAGLPIIDAQRVAEISSSLAPVQVDLRFPKFEFSTRAPLVSMLRSLGMNSAFDPELADFSAMTTEAPLFVSDVVHEAFISVDEAGTEAAAATAVVMDLTAAPVEAVELTVDRPFLLAIRHTATGAPLFLGQVVDPTKS